MFILLTTFWTESFLCKYLYTCRAIVKCMFSYMKFSRRELVDILKGWLGISIAFTILLSGTGKNTIFAFAIAFATVGLGFLLHELGHKLVAQRYQCWAEFRSFDQMILFAIITSFFGFILAAPGAVMIQGHVSLKKYGHIAIAGPIVNYILASLFFLFNFLSPNSLSYYGFLINSWLGLFNMIPLGFFDGAKVIKWSKFWFGVMIIIGIGLIVAQQIMIA